jgi:hypothetical protein
MSTVMHLIKWSKAYHEDIGEEDENGFFDYAYRYYVYCFYFPDKTMLKARRYTDTSDECALYFFEADGQWEGQLSEKLLQYLPLVVDFLSVNEGVKQFSYFNGNYVPLVLKASNERVAEFSFLEIDAEH